MVWRDKTTSAAETDSTAWGASDPTWSPDGKRLAFSLFGSIWIVDAQGGEAEQLTTSAGYHAHPAWSPKGDRIAFISGAVAGGSAPKHQRASGTSRRGHRRGAHYRNAKSDRRHTGLVR